MVKPKEDFEEEEIEKDEETRRIENLAEEIEMDTKKVYDSEKKEVDYWKLRATDMKGNTNMILPPPLIPEIEGELAVRREEFKKIFSKYKEENSNGGRQKQQLTQSQYKGLDKLRKKINSSQDRQD